MPFVPLLTRAFPYISPDRKIHQSQRRCVLAFSDQKVLRLNFTGWSGCYTAYYRSVLHTRAPIISQKYIGMDTYTPPFVLFLQKNTLFWQSRNMFRGIVLFCHYKIPFELLRKEDFYGDRNWIYTPCGTAAESAWLDDWTVCNACGNLRQDILILSYRRGAAYTGHRHADRGSAANRFERTAGFTSTRWFRQLSQARQRRERRSCCFAQIKKPHAWTLPVWWEIVHGAACMYDNTMLWVIYVFHQRLQ